MLHNKSKVLTNVDTTKMKKERPKLDLTGRRYGYLTVMEMLYHYKNGKTFCKCLCDCGNTHITSSAGLSQGKISSCGCKRYQMVGEKLTKDLTGFKIGKITVIHMTDRRAKNGAVYWEYVCECGNHGFGTFGDIKSGKHLSCGCYTKIKSQYETFVSDLLSGLKINYKTQYKFPKCKNVRSLPFDFYLPDHNICIECQGQQHYYAVDFFGGEDNFIKLQKRDKIKSDYCLQNNIMLICLPYTYSHEEMKNKILNSLSLVTITAV